MQATIKDNKLIVEFDIDKVDENILFLLTLIQRGKKNDLSNEEICKLSDEISDKSILDDEDIKKISKEFKDKWWQENKHKFIDENCN
jgi:hypothetical protein